MLVQLFRILFIVANLTLPTSTNSTAGFLQWANTTVGGYFGIGIDATLFIILMIGAFLGTGELSIGLLMGGAICSIIAIGLQALSLAPSYLMYVFMAVGALGFVLLMTRKSPSVY